MNSAKTGFLLSAGINPWYSPGMGDSAKWWIAGAVLAPFVLGACAATRAGYWSPSYSVVDRTGGKNRCEIRQYPELVLASTSAQADAEGRDGSFRRLFRFITGKNRDARKIPMTTPVFFRGRDGAESMSFVMPQNQTSPATPPEPADETVRIERRPAGFYAVLRMSGRRRTDREMAVARLQDALLGSLWKAEGTPEFASYDPPWIPSFLRKDEVFIPVKSLAERQ